MTIKGNPTTTLEKNAQAGQEVRDGKTLFKYVYVPASTAEGEVYVLSVSGTEAQSPSAVAVATSAFPVRTCVATEAQTAAGYQWVVIEGECDALVDGTTDVAEGDFLEVLNGADGFIKDGTSRTTVSAAIAREAQTTNADTLTKVTLIGEQHTIAAS
jgi:hypothetical protein